MSLFNYTHEEYQTDLIRLSGVLKYEFSGVYGVPRGGTILAHDLSRLLEISLLDKPTQGCLIVDDICDSGATLAQYEGVEYEDCVFAVLFTKNKLPTDYALHTVSEDTRVKFWWETGQDTSGGREQAIAALLRSINENPLRDGLKDTPQRVARAYDEWFKGYTAQPKLTTFDAEGFDQVILLKDIQVYSHCEHHIAPFFGRAHVAYIPDTKIIGISKLARIVDMFARRVQNQERLTQQIVEKINDVLTPRGAACIMECEHFCMRSRGISEQHSLMKTSKLTGAFLQEGTARKELFDLLT